MTTSTTPFEFGDIVLVPFPFTDQSASKKRPGVVVSNGAYNRARPDIVLMAVASQVGRSDGVFECPIAAWSAAGLLKPSVVKPVFATVERRLVLRALGRLDARDASSLRRWIGALLA
jgi:mRNA interferase MazF